MRDFCNSCEGSKTCEFVNGVSECACAEKVYFEDGYTEAVNDIIKALGNYWSTKEAEEFKEWFENTTDEFYQ